MAVPWPGSCRWRLRYSLTATAPSAFTLHPSISAGRPTCAAPVRKKPLTTPGPSRVILDTSILVAKDADLSGLACQISSVSYAELHFGIHAAPDEDARVF